MKRVFIVNPVAGNGRAKELIPLIRKLFPDGIIETTEYPEYCNRASHATKLAHDYSGPNTIIYSVGGDGTANEIVNGMSGGVALSIIPAGSGNDMIKSISDEIDPEEILRLESKNIESGRASNYRMDLGILRYNDSTTGILEEMYFMNVVSIGGIDAKVGEIANSNIGTRESNPNAIYKASVLPALLSFKAPHIKVDIGDERVVDQKITLFAVCNGGFYGGKYKIAPHALVNDGVLDICYVDKISKLRIPILMPSLEKGEHDKYDKIVHFIQARSCIVEQYKPLLKVKSDRPIPVNIDGQSKITDYCEIDEVHQGLIISTPRPKTLFKSRSI
jgi:diacylglycerol kinase family enzyme